MSNEPKEPRSAEAPTAADLQSEIEWLKGRVVLADADAAKYAAERDRLREVIRTGGAMYRAERATMGIPGGIDPNDLRSTVERQRAVIDAAMLMYAACPADPDATQKYEAAVDTFVDALAAIGLRMPASLPVANAQSPEPRSAEATTYERAAVQPPKTCACGPNEGCSTPGCGTLYVKRGAETTPVEPPFVTLSDRLVESMARFADEHALPLTLVSRRGQTAIIHDDNGCCVLDTTTPDKPCDFDCLVVDAINSVSGLAREVKWHRANRGRERATPVACVCAPDDQNEECPQHGRGIGGWIEHAKELRGENEALRERLTRIERVCQTDDDPNARVRAWEIAVGEERR